MFFPPMEYGLQSGTGINRRIYQFNMSDYSLEDITSVVAEHAEDFARQYQIIRSPENEEKTELALANAERMEMGLAPKATLQAAKARSGQAQAFSLAAVTKEDVRLQCEWKDTASFVPVKEEKNGEVKIYYGGAQAWYGDSRTSNGCGPVAAANIMYYMSTSSTTYKELYPYTTISKTIFTIFMEKMYDVVHPGSFGETSISDFSSDIKSWAKSNGISLTSYSESFTRTQEIASYRIKEGLRRDRPVALLNLKKGYEDEKYGEPFGWHWVTATKYFQSTDDTRWIAVSSWGTRYSLDWDAYWNAARYAFCAGGCVWFE